MLTLDERALAQDFKLDFFEPNASFFGSTDMIVYISAKDFNFRAWALHTLQYPQGLYCN